MISISVVSHGHGKMVSQLVKQLLAFPEVTRILITLNITESLVLPEDARIQVIENSLPQGFGTNHNAAYLLSDTPFFCVLNPDVSFPVNPFPALLHALETTNASLVVPVVVNQDGVVEDSLRRFITPWGMLKRLAKLSSGAYEVTPGGEPFCPEWAAGMFMLFSRASFSRLRGFDEGYFMYCEDADICTRLWALGGKLVAVPQAVVIHQAQRASRRSFRYLSWHVASMMRYMGRFIGRLPSVPDAMPIR